MTDSTIISTEGRLLALERDTEILKLRLANGPLHQSNGKGLFHTLFRTKEGRISREKALAFFMTAGPLILLPFLQDIGINPVLLNGAGAWFVANGGANWRARHQRDLPVDAPS